MLARTALLLALAAFAADDPEPPSDPSALLRGTWRSRVLVAGGVERAAGKGSSVVYTFERNRVTVTSPLAKGVPVEMALSFPDKKRKDVLAVRRGAQETLRYFFKIEKGELYLQPVRGD